MRLTSVILSLTTAFSLSLSLMLVLSFILFMTAIVGAVLFGFLTLLPSFSTPPKNKITLCSRSLGKFAFFTFAKNRTNHLFSSPTTHILYKPFIPFQPSSSLKFGL
jgi:hypothetical protein